MRPLDKLLSDNPDAAYRFWLDLLAEPCRSEHVMPDRIRSLMKTMGRLAWDQVWELLALRGQVDAVHIPADLCGRSPHFHLGFDPHRFILWGRTQFRCDLAKAVVVQRLRFNADDKVWHRVVDFLPEALEIRSILHVSEASEGLGPRCNGPYTDIAEVWDNEFASRCPAERAESAEEREHAERAALRLQARQRLAHLAQVARTHGHTLATWNKKAFATLPKAAGEH